MDPTQNDSLGSQTPMNMGYAGVPASTGTGDIVLAPEKKSKKWWIVGGVVGVLLLGIVIMIMFIWPNNKVGGRDGDMKSSFNRFANYVLYGEETVDEIDSALDTSYEYYFNNNSNNDETYERINGLYDVFLNNYNNQGKQGLDDNTNAWVNSEKEMLNFMTALYPKKRITVLSLLDSYMEGGHVKADEFASNYYVFNNNTSFYVERFSEDYNAWVDAALAFLDYYYNNGCLRNWGADYDCMIAKNSEAVIGEMDKRKDALKNASTVLDYHYSFSDDFVLGVYVLNAYINGGDVSDYVTGGDDASDTDSEEDNTNEE